MKSGQNKMEILSLKFTLEPIFISLSYLVNFIPTIYNFMEPKAQFSVQFRAHH